MVHPGAPATVATLATHLLSLVFETTEKRRKEALLFGLDNSFDVLVGHADITLRVVVPGAGCNEKVFNRLLIGPMVYALACSTFLFFPPIGPQHIGVGMLEGDFVCYRIFHGLEGRLLLLDSPMHVCLNYNML